MDSFCSATSAEISCVSNAMRPEAPAEIPSKAIAVLVAHSTYKLAEDVAAILRELNLKVKLWDRSQSSTAEVSECDIVVADPTSLSMLARQAADTVVEQKTLAHGVWRGGLAPRALRRVKEHIDNAITEEIALSDLAAMVKLSECHFARAFKQSVGVPPHRYIMSRRVFAAAELIVGSARELGDIALSVGFADQSHFTRVFVRVTGETPSGYRRRHR